MTNKVSIADAVIAIESPYAPEMTVRMAPFVSDGKAELFVRVEEAAQLPQCVGPAIYQQANFDVVHDGEGSLCRRYYDRLGGYICYALSRFSSDGKTMEVLSIPEGRKHMNQLENLFYHIQLENLLLQRDRMILHASCVETALGGLLFSGPSGIGKSTQAELWCHFEGARLLNGDRPILGRRSGVWRAYGSPYAGSSRCYLNESTPVRALILLEQGPDCTIRRASCAEAVRRLLEQITLNQWDPAFVSRVCALLDALLGEIPVYVLRCTPDRRAVDLLRQTLAADGRV